MKVTFDTNCLIDLEQREGDATSLRSLVDLHDRAQITICVPGIGASELLKDRTYARSFSVFHDRVRALSKKEFEILKPLAYFDIVYYDWAIMADDKLVVLEQQIHAVLFTTIAFRWQDHAQSCGLDPDEAAASHHPEWIKWRNRKCDALGMWCHIHYAGDCFVTRDGKFHESTKKPALIALGAKNISLPSEALTFVQGMAA